MDGQFPSLPIVEQAWTSRETIPKGLIPSQRSIDDFEALPDWFHLKLRSFITTEIPCHQCTKPQCSCSGYHRATVVLLPGEREWIEKQKGKTFRGGTINSFPVQGDCTFLIDKKCNCGWQRPWDCITFPYQPRVWEGKLVPYFAENCTFHPNRLNVQWIAERHKGWEYIFATIPEWVKIISDIPIYQPGT